MTTSLFAWFVMMVWIAAGAKSAPLIARGVAPVLRPFAWPVVTILRHLRLPFLTLLLVAVVVLLGGISGALYAYLTTSTSTCAIITNPDSTIFTCERGHPYHEQLVRIGTT